MRNIGKSILILSALVLGGSECFAADAARGKDLAHRWCSGCHLVTPDQPSTFVFTAPFASIAQRPNFNARELSASLLLPHPQMQDRALSRNEAADIAAYIGSLRK
jgi:mono/diheme cytochrome c family protein